MAAAALRMDVARYTLVFPDGRRETGDYVVLPCTHTPQALYEDGGDSQRKTRLAFPQIIADLEAAEQYARGRRSRNGR